VIDLCGEPVTGGTGLQNLRECIQWAEQKFNFEPKLKKVRAMKIPTVLQDNVKWKQATTFYNFQGILKILQNIFQWSLTTIIS